MTNPAAPLSRRLLITGSISAALLGGLAACTGSDAPSSEASPIPAFPTTVSHAYGSTTVKAEPNRIVVVGFTEQDALLAVGVVPIATTAWIGNEPSGVFPWAKDKLGDARPTVLESVEGLPMDQIQKLKPDLIIGTNAGLTQEDYTELSKIAPTIPNSGVYGNDYYEPWHTQTVLVGQAVGKLDQAEKLVADLTQRFADLAAAHPQFEGTTAAFVNAPYDDGSVIAWPNSMGTGFLTDLGFTVPSSIDKFVSEGQAQAEIPARDTSVLNDAKVLIWGDETDGGSAIKSDKVLGKLTAVKEGRSIYADELLTSAIYFGSILSLPYVLDRLVPELERVLPG